MERHDLPVGEEAEADVYEMDHLNKFFIVFQVD